MSDQSGREPALPSDLVEKLSGNEPMLSRFNVSRMGKAQRGFMRWLNSNPDKHKDGRREVSMLSAYQWMHSHMGFDGYSNSARRKLDLRAWTNAGLAKMLSSLHKRGLIVVFKDSEDRNHVRSRVPLLTFDEQEPTAEGIVT